MKLVVIASVLASAVIACSSSSDDSTGTNTGTSNGKLETQQDGQPTGDGKTCSWTGTAALASAPSSNTVLTHDVGAAFASLDSCNECSCTAQGIRCTTKACTTVDAGPVACPAVARVCQNGVAPTAGPSCTQVCPEDSSPSCGDLMTSAKAAIDAAIAKDLACTTDADCVSVQYATSCSMGCIAVIAKASQADYTSVRANVEATQCAQYQAHSCEAAEQACPAIAIVPKCTNNKCQGAVE